MDLCLYLQTMVMIFLNQTPYAQPQSWWYDRGGQSPRPQSQPRSHSNWWYDLGQDWQVSQILRRMNPHYSAYGHIARQMEYYAPATHVGKINTGELRHPDKYQPKGYVYGAGADFNQGELKEGVFEKVPDGEWVDALQEDVDAGLAKCVGDSFKLHTGVTVMDDGSFTVVTRNQLNPCASSPCRKYNIYTDCINEDIFRAKCVPRSFGPFQLDLVWTNRLNLDIRAMVIDAATGEVMGDNSDELFHADVSGAYGAIVPANKRLDNGLGVETMKFKTLADGTDYKDYIYAIMGTNAWSPDMDGVAEPELDATGAKLEVKYGGVTVGTYAIPQGPGANPPAYGGSIRNRYLFGCFKPGPNGHYLDTSVARFEWGAEPARARMAELCRPDPSELC